MESILNTIKRYIALDHNYFSKRCPPEGQKDYLDRWLSASNRSPIASEIPVHNAIAINEADEEGIQIEIQEESVSLSEIPNTGRKPKLQTADEEIKLLPTLFNPQESHSGDLILDNRLDDETAEEIQAKLKRCAKELSDLNYTNPRNKISIPIGSQYHDALNRYQSLITETESSSSTSFRERLLGGRTMEEDSFTSPFMGRLLRPFIFRDRVSLSPFLRLMLELKYQVTGLVPERAPIDYCYIRHGHIAAVNSLLEKLFWPGIDMSECLSYPEFSVVALYKRLVIGCGFLVPDVDHNEAYISFMAVRPEWQKCGIATFMIYHLTQTCLGKDITLHVSATNPAVCLYQKVGFKIEHLVLDFYENYMEPTEDRQSRHALFLRLKKS